MYITFSQILNGIAKDLVKLGGKSVSKLVTAEEKQLKLFKAVALVTGLKNSFKGIGYLIGAALLTAKCGSQLPCFTCVSHLVRPAVGPASCRLHAPGRRAQPTAAMLAAGADHSAHACSYYAAIAVMLALVVVAFPFAWFGLEWQLGRTGAKNVRLQQVFSMNRNICVLSIARFFLFGSRDLWFEVTLPYFLRSSASGIGWSRLLVGVFLAVRCPTPGNSLRVLACWATAAGLGLGQLPYHAAVPAVVPSSM